MSLDINAYSNVTLGKVFDEYNEDAEDYGVIQAYINPDFPGHSAREGWPASGWIYANVEDGEYYSFHAGTYNGYNAFRRKLAGWVHIEDVWGAPEVFQDTLPGYWLIDFSDCEGTIGPVVSMQLHAELEAYRLQFVNTLEEGPFANAYISVYDNFVKAFELASNDGFVIFH